jgi:hypothetical protein
VRTHRRQGKPAAPGFEDRQGVLNRYENSLLYRVAESLGIVRRGFRAKGPILSDGMLGRAMTRMSQQDKRTILGLGFLQQDDVGIGVAAKDAKTLAIR